MAGLDVQKWVDGFSVLVDLKMKVGTGHPSCGANPANQGSTVDLLPLLGIDLRKMPIVGQVRVRMLDLDEVAITPVDPGEDDRAAGRRVDRIAILSLQINPVM